MGKATLRKARYVHLCAACGKPIRVGSYYYDFPTKSKRTRYHTYCFTGEAP